MLRKEDFEHIGTLGRAHGTQGEVSAKLSVDLSGLWEGADTSLFLMLEEQGLLIPYRVLKRRTKGEDIDLITFSGITTKDEADALTGRPVWLDRDYLSGEEDVEDFFRPSALCRALDLYDASTQSCVGRAVEDRRIDNQYSTASRDDCWRGAHPPYLRGAH